MKIALMISFNTKTDEILFTKFVGDGCMDKAVDWADGYTDGPWCKDFPASEGWIHLPCGTKEALKELEG